MLKKIGFFLFLLPVFILSQGKLLTMEDVIFNAYTKLAPDNLTQLNWIPDTDNYYYIISNGNSQTLSYGNVSNEKIIEIISLDKLKELIGNNIQLNKFPIIKFIDKNTFCFKTQSDVFCYTISNGKLEKLYSLDSQAENIEYTNNWRNVAYTIENNLFAIFNDNKIQITNETNKDIISGQSVHRNEFGINKGIFWASSGNSVAYYRMDQSMVTDYPILDLDELPAKVDMIKYPMAGGISHEVTLGVYNFKTGKNVFLNTGLPKDQYLTSVTWSPDDKYIFIGLLNRDQNHLDMVKFDANTGEKLGILFTENDEQFVEPENPLLFLNENNTEFIWQSKRDGWNHLYLYDINGKMIKQVTKGDFEVTEVIGFDKKNKYIYFMSTENSPLERHLYKTNIKNLSKSQITSSKGTHSILFNNDKYFIDKFSNISVPRNIDIYEDNGDIIKNLLKADNKLSDYKISYPQIITIKDDNLPDLYGRLILPVDFDSTKKYPVIVYIYGGPHSQEVSNQFIYGRYDLWFQYMAQHGFIVFSVDNRGTSFRGNDFAQATFRKLGEVEIEDQMRGVRYLESLNFVDINRLGVYGWSYGGFMTTSLMLKTNDTFKVGACGGAVIDWKFYEIMYTERYMDTPQTNPEGYEKSSLLNYVDKLNGKLLLVHGTSDNTVVWQHTLSFVKKAVNLNKALDYFPYVHHLHGVSGKDALHLYNKISNYFIDNL